MKLESILLVFLVEKRIIKNMERTLQLPRKQDILIYTMGKTWAGHAFKELPPLGFNVCARWINVPDILDNPQDTFSAEIHANEEYKRKIWDEGCKVDCNAADMGILYTQVHDRNMLSGALVELGHITADNRPVYIIGSSASTEPAGDSDRAWKSQSCVYYWPHIADLKFGAQKAVEHYIAHYSEQWRERRFLKMRLPQPVRHIG